MAEYDYPGLSRRIDSVADYLVSLALQYRALAPLLQTEARLLRELGFRVANVSRPVQKDAALASALEGLSTWEVRLISIRMQSDRLRPDLLYELARASLSESIARVVNVTPVACELQE